MRTPELRLDLYQERGGTQEFHYVLYRRGQPGGRKHAPTLCGKPSAGMRSAAWFPPGDPRGAVHLERGCAECVAKLSDLLDQEE